MPFCGCFGYNEKKYQFSSSGDTNAYSSNDHVHKDRKISGSYVTSQTIQSYEEQLAVSQRNVKEVQAMQDILQESLKKASGLADERQTQIANLEAKVQTLQRKIMLLESTQKMKISERDLRIEELTETLQTVANNNHRIQRIPENIKAAPERRRAIIEHKKRVNRLPSKVSKSQEIEEQLYESLRRNELLGHVTSEQLREIVPYMRRKTFDKNELLFDQGDPGDGLYCLENGQCEIIKNGVSYSVVRPGQVFGEIAILYECKRTNAVKASTTVAVWYLERQVYHYAMEKLGKERIHALKKLVENTPLSKFSARKLAKIADAVTEEVFDERTYIVRQGEVGRTFYIIKEGTVDVTIYDGATTRQETLIRSLSEGKYFGEKALQVDGSKRTANIIAKSKRVVCLTLDKRDFDRVIGTIGGAQKDFEALTIPPTPRGSLATAHVPSTTSKMRNRHKRIELNELEKVICMGAGAYGRVDLVKSPRLGKVFALKKIKKHAIVEREEQVHVMRERDIMLECRNDFIVAMFKTFRDDRYIYMLMEACMGGELWSVLNREKKFSNNRARFYIGCVIEALNYLQEKKVVHRDIKLENLLLNERGYLQLADFGYAKVVEPGEKTWTFCGTPHYMAPEIIWSQGYDVAVDFWSLGVLLFELLNGNPPFNAESEEGIYRQTSLGIGAVRFPKDIHLSAKNLIRHLCKEKPTERLGYLKNGVDDIRNHKWFNGFDWKGLRSGRYIPEYVPNVSDGLDTRHFSPVESEELDDATVPKEMSGWDENF